MTDSSKLIGKNISILHRCSQIYVVKKLKKYNIGSGQYPFLIMLLKEDGISQEKLSDILHIDKGTTARAIKKLENQGYVSRKIDKDDKRGYKVYITKKTEEIKITLFKSLSTWREILLNDFNEDEKVKVIKILDKMTGNAISYMKNE